MQLSATCSVHEDLKHLIKLMTKELINSVVLCCPLATFLRLSFLVDFKTQKELVTGMCASNHHVIDFRSYASSLSLGPNR